MRLPHFVSLPSDPVQCSGAANDFGVYRAPCSITLPPGCDGFTLQESPLVVAIIVVMLSSVPSFQAQLAERHARVSVYQLYAAVQFATVVLAEHGNPRCAATM